ncbi:MAG TPA: hypothetical protein VMI55_07450 [Thermoplasmata archaeon]|nr:hypothetical protein [Thermoplasmata archaeon]
MNAGRPRRPAPASPPPTPPPRHSHAAIPVAIVLVGVGLYLGRYTVLLPALFGLALLWAGGSFLSTRLNPLSAHFYLTTKPSWSAIGVVFLGSLALFWAAYAMYLAKWAPLFPHV